MNALTETFRKKWVAERARTAFLALADGAVFHGVAFGACTDALGEAVFNTGMSGYQEILTDPSYAGQFVVLTAPEIGNYGCNPEDEESRALFLSGLIVAEANAPSNWRATESLQEYLTRNCRPGLYGVDTRALTLHLRDHGAQKAFLHVENTPLSETEAVARAKAWVGLDGQDYAARVTIEAPYVWASEGRWRVTVYDFGVKRNILRCLERLGCCVRVVPMVCSFPMGRQTPRPLPMRRNMCASCWPRASRSWGSAWGISCLGSPAGRPVRACRSGTMAATTR